MVANSAEVKLRSFSTKVHKVSPLCREGQAMSRGQTLTLHRCFFRRAPQPGLGRTMSL